MPFKERFSPKLDRLRRHQPKQDYATSSRVEMKKNYNYTYITTLDKRDEIILCRDVGRLPTIWITQDNMNFKFEFN